MPARRWLRRPRRAASGTGGSGLAHLARAKAADQLGQLAEADAEAVQALGLLRRGWPIFVAAALPAQAAIKHKLGDRNAAQELLREARRIVRDCPDPGIVPELIDTAERRLRRPPARRGAGPAAEPLTDREAAILRMLASQLSQREIGQELFVTLNTVKFHTRSIFRKLGVSTRAEAVARARELGLLQHRPPAPARQVPSPAPASGKAHPGGIRLRVRHPPRRDHPVPEAPTGKRKR